MLAAQHVLEAHPRGDATCGCIDCECKAIYEPVAPANQVCSCGHKVARHDQFCSLVECDETARRAGYIRVLSNGDAIFVCGTHSRALSPSEQSS